MNCVFTEHDRIGSSARYICGECGRVTAWMPIGKRIVARCHRKPMRQNDTHWANCPHRGPVVATITGRVAGCGCSGDRIEVYQCQHPSINEPVIKFGRPPCLDTLREQVPGATGRTCRECKVSMGTIDRGDVSGWSGLF